MNGGLNQSEQFLSEEVTRLTNQLVERNRQLQDAHETVQLLERLIHGAAAIAGHIPFLVATYEGGPELENAAAQLQRLLIHRQMHEG